MGYCTYHVLFLWYSRLWGQQLLWGSNHSGHDTVVERCFLLSGLFQDLGRQRFRENRYKKNEEWVNIFVERFPLSPSTTNTVSLNITHRFHVTVDAHLSYSGSSDLSHVHCHAISNSEQLTQPVASNILRSSGSPDSWPSILVREWQVAMQATNWDLTRFSL